MALSSARLLLNFFEESYEGYEEYRLAPLIAALDDIEKHLPLWEAQGNDVRAFRDALPAWTAGVLSHLSERGEVRSDGLPVQTGDLGVLRWAAKLLEADTPSLDESQREEVRNMVNEARGVLRADETLPEAMRLHIVTLLLHVESVLDNFQVMGDFALEDAVERLLGAMRFAENASSSEPNVWQKFYGDWLQPVATAMLGGAPGTALAITALLGG